jgi:hypothetical protein
MVPGIQFIQPTGVDVDPLRTFADSLSVFNPYQPPPEVPRGKEDRYSEFIAQASTEPTKEGGNGASHVVDVTGPIYTEKKTRQYAELVFERNMKEIPSLLDQLRVNLENPEGARFMQGVRERLRRIWEIADALPKEKILFLSALEETVRDKRWRDLAPGQVQVLEQIVKQAENGTVNLGFTLGTLHRNFIDIYPSASIDESDENE